MSTSAILASVFAVSGAMNKRSAHKPNFCMIRPFLRFPCPRMHRLNRIIGATKVAKVKGLAKSAADGVTIHFTFSSGLYKKANQEWNFVGGYSSTVYAEKNALTLHKKGIDFASSFMVERMLMSFSIIWSMAIATWLRKFFVRIFEISICSLFSGKSLQDYQL